MQTIYVGFETDSNEGKEEEMREGERREWEKQLSAHISKTGDQRGELLHCGDRPTRLRRVEGLQTDSVERREDEMGPLKQVCTHKS
jgi:hypothetical protein